MKFAESIRRNILETTGGRIINKFKVKSRRTTMFFEDILAQYVRECEAQGHSLEMREVGLEWGALGTKQLGKLGMFQSIRLLNHVMNSVWSSLGLVRDFSVKKNGDDVTITTRDEFITRVIGKNDFMAGFFAGCIMTYTGKRVEYIDSGPRSGCFVYRYSLGKNTAQARGKNKDVYNKLNQSGRTHGLSLKQAIQKRIFTVSGNRVYFRGKSMIPVENTVFHIIGRKGMCMDKIPAITAGFFRGLLSAGSTTEKRLRLLKTILQSTGWCDIVMTKTGENLSMHITGLPTGLQEDEDNWSFLIGVIEGYVSLLGKRAKLASSGATRREIVMRFTGVA